MKTTIKLFYFLFFVYSCSFTKLAERSGSVFVDRETAVDYALLYYNDSLDFSVSYWGDTKYLVAPSNKTLRGLMPALYQTGLKKYPGQRCLILYKKNSETPSRRFLVYSQGIVDLNDSRNKIFSHLKKQKTVIDIDTIATDTAFKFDHREIRYTLESKSLTVDVLEYHVMANRTICRFVFTQEGSKGNIEKNAYLKKRKFLERDARSVMQTFKEKIKERLQEEYMTSPSMMASNLFIDSKYNYLEPLYWLNHFSSIDTLAKRKRSVASASNTFNCFIGKFIPPKADNNAVQSLPIGSNEYTVSNAVNEIIDRAGSQQVVMLNEDHLNPYDRVFAKALLPGLFKRGYRYLAVETLTYDSLLNERKFPLKSSGFYVAEPSFGNFLREALKLGYQLVPYENDQPCECSDVYCRVNCRDSMQAINIANILTQDPKAKIMVYAGHSHIYKKASNPKVKYMAERFAAITGIEPFCIDQIELGDQSSYVIDSSQNNASGILKRITESSSIKDKDGNFWVLPSCKGAIDMHIVHPVANIEKGCPSWLVNKGENHIDLKFKGKKYDGTLFQVLYKSEVAANQEKAIPLVNFGLSIDNHIQLSLPDDAFYLQVINRNGTKDFQKEVNFK